MSPVREGGSLAAEITLQVGVVPCSPQQSGGLRGRSLPIAPFFPDWDTLGSLRVAGNCLDEPGHVRLPIYPSPVASLALSANKCGGLGGGLGREAPARINWCLLNTR